jgi:signal recognition particle receptor subunit beta
VYWGADFAGKKSNIEEMYKSATNSDKEIKRIKVKTETQEDEILYSQFLALEMGTTHKFRNRFHLYALSKNSFNPMANRLLLEGVDGIIFVANSQQGQMDANLISLACLKENLNILGININNIALVLQLNKRDLPSLYPVDTMKELLVFNDFPCYESIANKSIGIDASFKALILQILGSRKKSFRALTISCL